MTDENSTAAGSEGVLDDEQGALANLQLYAFCPSENYFTLCGGRGTLQA